MKNEIQNMAGVDESNLPKNKNKNGKVKKSDSIRNMAGLNESNDNILIEDKEGVDKLYLQLAEEFKYDSESLNKIKEIFSKVVVK